MKRRRGSGVRGDDLVRLVEIAGDLRRRQPQEVAMPMTVDGDRVAAGDDLAGDIRRREHALADHEERRFGVTQRVEHGRSAERVRTIVEGERDAAVDAPREPQRGRDRRRDRGERGHGPHGRGGGENQAHA